jgi:ribosomal protein S18 acetylase RimI-like enzyme
VLAQHSKLWLHVRASNVAAIGLYEKLGMFELQRLAKFYSNGEDALILGTRQLRVKS